MRDLTKLTAAEHEQITKQLAAMPMSKLRQRQAQLERELQVARGEFMISNLLVIEQHLDAAIDKKSFGRSDARRRKTMYR
jgi:hypothetical protein